MACRSSCTDASNRRVVIIIPYRNRQQHLVQLIPNLERLLNRQNICYQLIVSEQINNQPFNKGILMNAAFVEALNYIPFHCAIFHDVDLIPLNDLVPYNCSIFPKHISLFVDKFNFQLPYLDLIGGVLSIPVKIFLRVNGFSNLFWNWGAEDDDMHGRLMLNGIPISRPNPKLARFKMLKHSASPAFSTHLRSEILKFTEARYRLDGLNSLNYTLIDVKTYFDTGTQLLKDSLVHLKIDVGSPPTYLIQS